MCKHLLCICIILCNYIYTHVHGYTIKIACDTYEPISVIIIWKNDVNRTLNV